MKRAGRVIKRPQEFRIGKSYARRIHDDVFAVGVARAVCIGYGDALRPKRLGKTRPGRVGTADAVSGVFKHTRQRAHAYATDPYEMYRIFFRYAEHRLILPPL